MFKDPKTYAADLMNVNGGDLDGALLDVVHGARDWPDTPSAFWRDVARECVILAGVLTVAE